MEKMIKMMRVAVIILAIFGMVFNISGVSFAQDDDGGGGGGGGDSGGDYGGDVGDAGDFSDAGDASDAGDTADASNVADARDVVGAVDTDDRGIVVADYREETAVEAQYEEPIVPVPVTTSTTTNVTNVYTRGGYVYDRGRSAVVDAAVVGAVVGAAAVNAAASTGKSGAVAEKTTKRPVVIKKRPPTKTTEQVTSQIVRAPTQTTDKQDKK